MSRPSAAPRPRPEIRAVSFETATIRSGRIAVARIDCAGVLPQELRCHAVRPGFTAEVLPTHALDGRFVLLGIRICRQRDTPSNLCLLRLSAGSSSSLASITVLP